MSYLLLGTNSNTNTLKESRLSNYPAFLLPKIFLHPFKFQANVFFFELALA